MKTISPQMFAELKSQNARLDVCWLCVRPDGQRFAFTSSDIPIVYNGDTYSPTNGFNGSASVSRAGMSVDNMEVQVLSNELITEPDLRAGLWSNADVNVFWISRYHPEWGIVPIRGGRTGEIVVKEGQFTTQLRSLFQQLQQPFGYFFVLQCGAQLGDPRCKVKLAVPEWQPNHTYKLGILGDANVGDVVKPHVDNGFWYVANYQAWSDPERAPTIAGQGLSGNDDLGPNDSTQTAVGAPPSNLNQFNYTGVPVDIFGIKI